MNNSIAKVLKYFQRIKLAMLQEYIPQGIASKSQLQKISRFVDFCTFVFNSWWFNCPLAASAPHQDLELDNNIKSFANVDLL